MKNIYRSAITGQLVTKQFAKDHPNETVKESIESERTKLRHFCDFLEENGRPIDYTLINEYLKLG